MYITLQVSILCTLNTKEGSNRRGMSHPIPLVVLAAPYGSVKSQIQQDGEGRVEVCASLKNSPQSPSLGEETEENSVSTQNQ